MSLCRYKNGARSLTTIICNPTNYCYTRSKRSTPIMISNTTNAIKIHKKSNRDMSTMCFYIYELFCTKLTNYANRKLSRQ